MKTLQDFPSINERAPDGLKTDGSAFRVMIVDDSMFVAKQLGQIHTSEGYEVIATAADGKEGVDKYKELAPNVDLVTMDITMPVMDGIEAVREIIEIDPGAKVIMVTAAGQKTNMVEALKRGAADFIQKPFDSAVIINTIEKVLEDE